MLNKEQLFNEFESALEGDSVESTIKYMFDYFPIERLRELLQHIKEEKGWFDPEEEEEE